MKIKRIIAASFIVLLLFSSFQGMFFNKFYNQTSTLGGDDDLDTQANESSDSMGDEWRMFGKYLNRTRSTTTIPQRGSDYFWRYGVSSWIEYSSPAVADDRVFFTSADKNIYCVNATTGQYIWSFWEWAAATYSSPAVANGYVYWQHWDYMYCRNVADGTPVWSTYIGSSWFSPSAVANGRVYIGVSGNLTCLDALNGDILWSSEMGGTIDGGPAIVNGRAFIGSSNDKLYCFNATNGNEIWNSTTLGDIDDTPAIANGRVYFGSNDDNVYCLNETSGEKLWNYTTNGDIWTSPAVANGGVYIAGFDGYLYCLNATNGIQIWNYSIGGQIWSSPAVANNMVFIGGLDEYLYCLNASNGEEIWKYKSSGDITSSPAIANGRIYFGTRSSRLYCIPMIFDFPPDVDLLSPPNGTTIPQAKILYFNISDPEGDLNTTWYSLDGGQDVTLEAPYQIDTSSWAPGLHTLVVSANDTYEFLTSKTYVFKIGPPTALFEDVEHGTNGWNTSGIPASNETYGWHIVTNDSYSPTHAWWCGDDNTSQTGNNWNISLVSPLINLTTAYNVNLSFYQKYDIDQDSDYGYVEININGTPTWTPIASFTGSQSSWIENTYNISSYVGNHVYIRFRFESDSGGTADGWYVDDICIDIRENFNGPLLTDAEVDPSHGTTWITFTFWVNYTDIDDNSPAYVNVVIDGASYTMEKHDPSDSYYRDGCLYKYHTKLANITHDHYFNASDGIYTAREPTSGNFSGPLVDLYLPKGPLLEDWYQTWGGGEDEYGMDVAVDVNNNSYLVGHSESFGAGNQDAFIVKYDSEGNQIWNRTWGGAQNDEFYGVAVDTNGGIYAVGETSSFAIGSSDALIVKYNATGYQEWNQTYGTVNFDSAQDVVVDNDNNISVVGSTTPSNVDALLLKYNATGTLLNVTTWGGSASDRGYGIVIDHENNTIIVGQTNSFGGVGYEAFFAKFDSGGNLLKNQTWGGVNDDTAYGVDVDLESNIYLAGTSSINAFVLKYNASGDLERQQFWTAGTQAYGYDVSTDEEGNYFLFGYVVFSGGTDYNGSLVKYDKFGNLIWNTTWGYLSYDREITYGYAMGQYDDFYFSGRIYMGTGDVYDGLLVKLYWPVPPPEPELEVIQPNPDNNGLILLNWTEIEEASIYYIYRDTQNIADIEGLTPIKSTTSSISGDVVLTNDTYYYAIVAGNVGGNSTPSNCESVVAAIRPSLLEWNQTWGGDEYEYCQGMAVDIFGNVYLTGHTRSFGAGNWDAFLVKFNSTGYRLWNVTWGGTSTEWIRAVATDNNNDIYITGVTDSFDVGAGDALLVKYNPAGTQLWNRTWEKGSQEKGYGVAADSQDNVYMTGPRLVSGNWEALLVKYDSIGNEIWNRTWGGSGVEWCYGVSVDDYDYVYIIGYTTSFGVVNQDGFLVKYDSEGNQIWNRTWGGSNDDIWRGVAIDKNNNSYVLGSTNSFGLGSWDFALVKYNSIGNQLWNKTWGGTNTDYGYSVVVDTNGSCYIAGYTESYSLGQEDAVLIKYNSSGHQLWIRRWGGLGSEICVGADLDINLNCHLAGYSQDPGASATDSFVIKYATGTPLPVNDAPILSNGSVSPSIGRHFTEFNFEVNYTDGNNDPPVSILVYINGSDHTMTKRFTDTDYTDGCIYEYKTTLSPGTYTYYFTASDFGDSARLPAATEFDGPTVSPNQIPQLSDPILSPAAGNNLTIYTFYINYSDADNDMPQNVDLIIDGVGTFAMNQQNPSDSNYINGCIYNYSLYLDIGNYTHYFNVSDGYDTIRFPLVGSLVGPNVSAILNQAPELLNGSVTPTSGNLSTIFTFKVTYRDTENDTPSEIYVILDGLSYGMNKSNPADANFTEGVEYIYATTLIAGPHMYYFTASDGIQSDRYPSAGSLEGPTIQGGDEEPPNLLWIIIIIAIGAAVGVTTGVLIYKRRGGEVSPLILKGKPNWVSKAFSYTPEFEQKLAELIMNPQKPKKIKDLELLDFLQKPFTTLSSKIIGQLDKMPYTEEEKIEILKTLISLPPDQRQLWLAEILDEQQREAAS